jgi:hypothetical protein
MSTIDTEIRYDRLTGDYLCLVDGRCVGYRATYSQGEALVNQIVYDLLADGMAYTAAELDTDPEPPEEEQGPCDDINITEPDRARAPLLLHA